MKKILIVNACDGKKNFIFEELYKLEYKVYVLNRHRLPNIQDFVDSWILEDTTDIELCVQKVSEIHKKEAFDGILTFWEDDVILTAKINEGLGLKWIPYSQAKNIRNKFEFRKLCKKLEIKHPNFMMIDASTSKDDIKDFSFPCVLKPAFGASNAFVSKCYSPEDVLSKYDLAKKSLLLEIESALHNGDAFFIESFISGNELDIDILVQNGEIRHISVTDNFDSQSGFFMEIGQCSPSQFYKEEEKNIKKQSINIIQKLGIRDACLHFEAKYKEGVLTPIELNLRMWWDETWYLGKELYDVNLIDAAVKIACAENIEDTTHKEAKCRIYSEDIFPEKAGYIRSIEVDTNRLLHLWVIHYGIVKKVWDYIGTPPEDVSYIAWYMTKCEILDKDTRWENSQSIKDCFHIEIEEE